MKPMFDIGKYRKQSTNHPIERWSEWHPNSSILHSPKRNRIMLNLENCDDNLYTVSLSLIVTSFSSKNHLLQWTSYSERFESLWRKHPHVCFGISIAWHCFLCQQASRGMPYPFARGYGRPLYSEIWGDFAGGESSVVSTGMPGIMTFYITKKWCQKWGAVEKSCFSEHLDQSALIKICMIML